MGSGLVGTGVVTFMTGRGSGYGHGGGLKNGNMSRSQSEYGNVWLSRDDFDPGVAMDGIQVYSQRVRSYSIKPERELLIISSLSRSLLERESIMFVSPSADNVPLMCKFILNVIPHASQTAQHPLCEILPDDPQFRDTLVDAAPVPLSTLRNLGTRINGTKRAITVV